VKRTPQPESRTPSIAGERAGGPARQRRPVRSRTGPSDQRRAAARPVGDRAQEQAPAPGQSPLTGPLARSLLARRLLARKGGQSDGNSREDRPLRVR
jgi:hypothetical protein